MKLLLVFFLNIFLVSSCGCINNSKSNEATNVTTALETTNDMPQETAMTFEYVASTRGSYQKIVINRDDVLKTKKRGGSLTGASCNVQDWNNLLELLNRIDLDVLSTFEAPSKDFQFDGAPLARLIVATNNETYETQGFDHGNPPKEIADLVKEILSISENIE